MPKGNADFDGRQGEVTSLVFGQKWHVWNREHLMGPTRCVGTEVAFGAAVARRFGGVAFWLAWVLDGATWGAVPPQLANCRAGAEKPATGKYRGRAWGREAFDAPG